MSAAVDLDELELVDPDLAARLRAHLDVEAAVELLDTAPPAVEPAPSAVVPFAPADTSADEASWDDYWRRVRDAEDAARGEAPTETIRGVKVRVPTSLPMRFDRDLERMESSTDLDDVKHLLRTLFGGDVLDAWVEAGMHEDEFRVALLWGIAHGKGRPLTVAQAHEAVRTQGESMRPAPANRAERRAPARKAPARKGKGAPKRAAARSATR